MRTQHATSSLFRSGATALVAKVLAAGLSFVMFALLARLLGPEAYGRYASAFSAGTFLSFVLLAGLHTDALRVLPSLYNRGTAEETRSFLASSLQAFGLVLLGALIFGVATALAFRALNQAATSAMVAYTLGFAISLALAEYLAHLIRAFGAVNLALLPRDVIWRALVVAATVGFGWLNFKPGITFVVWLSVLLLLASLAGQIILARTLVPLSSTPARKMPVPALLWRARWLAAAAIASNFLQPLSVVAVGAVLSYFDSGVFFAAQKTAALLSLPLIAMNMIGAPRIAQAWADGDLKGVQTICTYTALGGTIPTLVGFAIILALSDTLLGIFDASYQNYGAVLVILALGNMLNTAAGPTGYLMLMTGHEKRYVVISAIAQAIGIMIVVLGGTFWGLKGAAIGEVAGIAILNGLIWHWGWKNLGVDSSVFSIGRK